MEEGVRGYLLERKTSGTRVYKFADRQVGVNEENWSYSPLSHSSGVYRQKEGKLRIIVREGEEFAELFETN